MKYAVNKLKRILGIIVGGFILTLLGIMISIPLVNDHVAKKTAKVIEKIELPEHTEYMESFWKAGKLIGNGNGMQYLGGILIKSELSIDELQTYYSQYANEEWECIVEKQAGKSIQWIEHGMLSLNSNLSGENYYIVYSWGHNDFVFFSEFDLRGH